MTLTRPLFFVVAAIICFVIAELLETAVIHGSDLRAWVIGGFIALACSFLP